MRPHSSDTTLTAVCSTLAIIVALAFGGNGGKVDQLVSTTATVTPQSVYLPLSANRFDPLATSTPTPTRTPCGVMKGVIDSDTTLVSGCDYLVTGNILVNAALTIQPGVNVKFDGYYYIRIKGVIRALGSKDALIVFTSNKLVPQRGDWFGLELASNSQNSFSNVIVEYSGRGLFGYPFVTVQDSIFRYNGQVMDLSTNGNGQVVVTSTQIISNTATGDLIVVGHDGTVFQNNLIEHNLETGSSAGLMRVGCKNSQGDVSNNIIRNNKAQSVVWYVIPADEPCVHHNTVTSNTVMSDVGGVIRVWTFFHENNVNGNTAKNTILAGDWLSLTADITQNYWGTTDPNEINNMIRDYNDDFNLQKSVYSPFLVAPVQTTQ